MNVSFEYLYRDGANYKNWGEIIFKTTSGLSISDLERRIQECLIDGQHFVAEDLDVPVLYFPIRDAEGDHGWREYSGISWTNEDPTRAESIEEFIHRLYSSKGGRRQTFKM